jgi:hypothetical protein
MGKGEGAPSKPKSQAKLLPAEDKFMRFDEMDAFLQVRVHGLGVGVGVGVGVCVYVCVSECLRVFMCCV